MREWERDVVAGWSWTCVPPSLSLSIYLLEMELVFYSLFGSDFKQ